VRVRDSAPGLPPHRFASILANGAGPAPAIRIERRQIPYWQERGWALQGNTYSGSYQTPYAAFQGWIEQEKSGHIEFYLYNPPDEIAITATGLVSSTVAMTGTWFTWAGSRGTSVPESSPSKD